MTDRPFIHTVERLAAVIISERERQNLTREQLAELAGVSMGFLEDLESARPRAEVGKTMKTLKALGLKPRAVPATTQWAFDETGKVKEQYADADFSPDPKSRPSIDDLFSILLDDQGKLKEEFKSKSDPRRFRD